jgi:hypothetical protein
MKDLQLTDEYTMYGLSKEEYEDACYHIDRHSSLKEGEETDLNLAMFKDDFKFDMKTIVGDGIFDEGMRSIPLKVANEIVEMVTHGDKKSYKCYVNKNWKLEKPDGTIIHEDAYSSINCAINALGKPYAFIITKSDYIRRK